MHKIAHIPPLYRGGSRFCHAIIGAAAFTLCVFQTCLHAMTNRETSGFRLKNTYLPKVTGLVNGVGSSPRLWAHIRWPRGWRTSLGENVRDAVGSVRSIAWALKDAVRAAGQALMRVVGKATYRTEVVGDRLRRVIGWELLPWELCVLASAIVRQARIDGRRKLPWFWKKTRALGWSEDERAWWILTGYWNDIRYGADLAKVF